MSIREKLKGKSLHFDSSKGGHYYTVTPEERDEILAQLPAADRPGIVCLCGSSRFVAQMAIISWQLEKDGWIVLSLHLLPDWYEGLEDDHQAEAEGVAEQMDELHLRKIDLADKVLIVNLQGYIGESTTREIAYAKKTGKPVAYVEDV